MIQEGIVMGQAEGGGLPVLGAQAAGEGLAEHVLEGAVLQVTLERTAHVRPEAVKPVPLLRQQRAIAEQPLGIRPALSGPGRVGQARHHPFCGGCVFPEDRMIVVLRPGSDFTG